MLGLVLEVVETYLIKPVNDIQPQALIGKALSALAKVLVISALIPINPFIMYQISPIQINDASETSFLFNIYFKSIFFKRNNSKEQ